MQADAKDRIKERVSRIRDNVPILEVLSHYGYVVHVDVDDREQQFSCDLHGDGQDSKPSARVYPETSSWYCFACNVARDAIKTVQDKEGLSFSQACYRLENVYGLPHPVDWTFGEEGEGTPAPSPEDMIRIVSTSTYAEEQAQVENLLLHLTKDCILQMQLSLQLWELFDRVSWSVAKEVWDESKGKKYLLKLKAKVIELGTKALQESA